MALKPPPIGEVIQQVNALVSNNPIREDLDRNARTLLQSALARLDVVSREEFDTQAAVLGRMRQRIQALEAELTALQAKVEELEQRRVD
jgi:BMFP domain-containing protein YqiC